MVKKREKWGGEEEPPCAIQMGPMMDCTFLLLLYFISVSTIDSVRLSKEVRLPVAKKGIAEKDKAGQFIVDVEWDDNRAEAVFKTGVTTLTDARDLVPLIQASKRYSPRNFRIIVRTDKRVPYEYTQKVMEAIAEADVARLNFSTLETERN